MKFRGARRVNKPQSGLFSSHYIRKDLENSPQYAAVPRYAKTASQHFCCDAAVSLFFAPQLQALGFPLTVLFTVLRRRGTLLFIRPRPAQSFISLPVSADSWIAHMTSVR